MKTKLLFVGLLLGAASLTSCKKDYECSCDSEFGDYSFTLTESTKAAAEAVCEGEGIGGYEVEGESVDMSGDDCTIQ